MSNFRLNMQTTLVTLGLLLFIIFLLQNTGEMRVKFLLLDEQVPSIILILVTALGGFTAGYFFALRGQRQRRKQREIKEQARQAQQQDQD